MRSCVGKFTLFVFNELQRTNLGFQMLPVLVTRSAACDEIDSGELMKASRLFLVVAALTIFALQAHADTNPVTMVFTGVNGVNDGHFYVSPYNGTMNGQAVTLFCDDVINEVSFNQTWQANVTNLASGDLSNTRYGNAGIAVNPSVINNAQKIYEEAAWLSTQFASNPGDYVSLQYAIWDLMNPGSEPTGYGNVQFWLDQSAANYGSIDPSNFSIVTNAGPLAMTGQVQEFIINTPEPGTLSLLLIALASIAILAFRRQTATV